MELPDAEAMVITFLQGKLGVPVTTRVPNPRPKAFVRAWRSGGAAQNPVLDIPHITVTAWAEDSVAASDLASRARHALFNDHIEMPLVRRVEEVGGKHFDPDLDTGTPRYTFTVSLRVRAARN